MLPLPDDLPSTVRVDAKLRVEMHEPNDRMRIKIKSLLSIMKVMTIGTECLSNNRT